MPQKTYLWTEDRTDKSGFIFWKTMMEQLFPNIIVESKKNNSGLIKAVRDLSDYENQYLREKRKAILQNTSLEAGFKKAGLEVII